MRDGLNNSWTGTEQRIGPPPITASANRSGRRIRFTTGSLKGLGSTTRRRCSGGGGGLCAGARPVVEHQQPAGQRRHRAVQPDIDLAAGVRELHVAIIRESGCGESVDRCFACAANCRRQLSIVLAPTRHSSSGRQSKPTARCSKWFHLPKGRRRGPLRDLY